MPDEAPVTSAVDVVSTLEVAALPDLDTDARSLDVPAAAPDFCTCARAWLPGPDAAIQVRPGRDRSRDQVLTVSQPRSSVRSAFLAVVLLTGMPAASASGDAEWRRQPQARGQALVAAPGDEEACRAFYDTWFTPFFGNTAARARSRGSFCASTAESRRTQGAPCRSLHRRVSGQL